MSDPSCSPKNPSDKDLLRLIYRHLDWLGVVEDSPGLSMKRIEDFFKRMESLLPEEPARRPESKPADVAPGFAKATPGKQPPEQPVIARSEATKQSLHATSKPAVGASSPIKALILNVDGGSRGNPGPAGCGAVLFDSSGNVVEEMDRFLGRATNNEAEYQALIMGLKGARARGVEQITIRADSQLMVRQINGEYKVKSPNLKPLFDEVKSLLSGFSTWRAVHVRREQNARADALANRAMDRGRS